MPHIATYQDSGRDVQQPLPHPGKSNKILLMDDDESFRYLLSLRLTRQGYDVVAVPEGGAAIETYLMASREGTPFVAVIFDLHNKVGMGGQAALAHLRQWDPDIRAIVCSADDDDPVMQDYDLYGFAAKLCKPFESRALQSVLSDVIDAQLLWA